MTTLLCVLAVINQDYVSSESEHNQTSQQSTFQKVADPRLVDAVQSVELRLAAASGQGGQGTGVIPPLKASLELSNG